MGKRTWIWAALAVALVVVAVMVGARSLSRPVSKTTITAAEIPPKWTDVALADFSVSLPGTPTMGIRHELGPGGGPAVTVVTHTVNRNGAELSAVLLTVEGRQESACENVLDGTANETIETLKAGMRKRGARPSLVDDRTISMFDLPARHIELASAEPNGSSRQIRYLMLHEGCRVLIVVSSTAPDTAHLSQPVFDSIRRVNGDVSSDPMTPNDGHAR